MLHTFVALVQDKPGVLTRVASLFRRLNINIVSLTVGPSERRSQSRMTIVADAPDKPYAALLAHYLSASHRDEPGKGCAFAALASDAGRGGSAVRRAFAEGLQPLLDILANALPGFSKAARRRKAVAAMAALVGALALSRAVEDEALSNEILEAVRHELRDASYR